MTSQTYIFIGRSGCGKGTQAALLEEVLTKEDSKLPVVHLESGRLLREFIKGATYTQELSKNIYDTGGLQPEFLVVHLWTNHFVLNMRRECHLIIDGSPRKLNESSVLHTAFQFYSRSSPHVILLDVSRKWSETRLIERKRQDDNIDDIRFRLDWFESEVMPVIEYYRHDPFYRFHEVNGERPIQEIHEDIVKKLELL